MGLAYVYVWIHYTGRYYIGYHAGYNSHYICSSKLVKPLILQHPTHWIRVILAEGTIDEMYLLETMLLQALDAKNDPMSYNQHNNSNNFRCKGHTEEYKKRKSIEKKGKPNGHKGMKRSQETRQRMSLAQRGRTLTPEHRAKISIALKGRKKK